MPTALIADIRGSRDLNNWPEAFSAIKKNLDQANRRFKDDLVVKFHPTVGDEFQGVLSRPEIAFDAYLFLKAALSPLRLYFGLGVGEVEKPGPGETGMRGSAFYRARAALEECKNAHGTIRLRLQGETTPYEKVLNGTLKLIEVIEDDWTDRQREIVDYYRLQDKQSYENVGHAFNISKQAVSKTIKSSNLQAIMEAEKQIQEALQSTL